ncbi:NADH-quinone oxidoreductase, M subunit NuoM [Marmoricola endophyticus]|uniref:NADH-quinone oxidoreductase, M subunit NuoM n=1 Tax=Marmoricola endophyticus TaxID=2040280 RepID=A0A917BNQ9_9ACTN|nr:NADH-quinone oxidoreductase subunit M [Marmoricola endophyticus]GGF51039.1 NADH-quinone oxidoreductase, M subunit NuoM [Marmoricola endophyticus]
MLTALLLVPLVGGLVVAFAPTRRNPLLTKQLALVVSLAVLVLAVVIAVGYDPGGGMQYVEEISWISAFGTHYALGVDGLGLALVLLTAVLTPIVILAAWNDGDEGRWGTGTYFGFLLGLEALSLGVFAATDVFLFYVLFEATLIPTYFLIGGWGGPDRARAAAKLLIYNLLGGLVMLVAVIGLYVESAKAGTPSYLLSDLSNLDLSTGVERWLFVGFFIAFAIKAPMFPVHTWLPDATQQGTPGVSVMLVSILDKIGTFGMLRYCLGIFPDASQWATPVVIVLALISILYGALVAIGQDDMMRLIGLTSVSHFGFIVIGIFVFNSQGQSGSTLYMVNHGISTAALFLVAGFLVKRRRSQLISDYGGVEKVAPVLAGFLLLSGLSVLSLPGMATFVSELLVLVGAWVEHPWIAIVAVPGIVLAAVYVLRMYQRTMTGPVAPGVEVVTDLRPREVVAAVPLIVLLVVLGFYPKPLLDVIDPYVQDTLSHVGKADPAPAVGSAPESRADSAGSDQ